MVVGGGGWHSRIESLQVLSTLDFRLWTLDLDLNCDKNGAWSCSGLENNFPELNSLHCMKGSAGAHFKSSVRDFSFSVFSYNLTNQYRKSNPFSKS